MFNAYTVNTLEYNAESCIGCEMCVDVCPHAVFAMHERMAQLVRPEACMECGACQRNCPVGAITVKAGVGCAAYMIYEAMNKPIGRKNTSARMSPCS